MNQTFTMACYNRKPVTRNRVASQKILSLFNVTGTNRHKPSCNCQSANWIQLIYKSWNVILGSKGKVTLFEIKDLWHLVLEHASLSQHDYLPVSPGKRPLKLMIEQNWSVACIGSSLSCEYNTSGTQTAPRERGLRKPGFNSSIKWSTYINHLFLNQCVLFNKHTVITLLVHPQSLPWFTWKFMLSKFDISPFRIIC